MACTALSVAVAATLGMYGSTALAQATTGAIFGQAQAGETVVIQSTSGLSRQVVVDSTGHYAVSSLPLGSYTVTLQQNGQAVDSRSNVTLRVGSGTEVSFGAPNAQNLAAVTVQANALPTIDVSGVDSRTVITSEQMARLPLLRSAEAIALLAPGVVEGSGMFMGVMTPTTSSALQKTGASTVSFGGSSVTENAYYINGFNTTDPLGGFGGLTLPYGSIEQQEILSGGYGAAYGRSDGGVISQVGKRGTNEWHFGGQVQWSPTDLQGDPKDYYLVNQDGTRGNIRQRRHDNKSWVTTVDAYVGGPLIKDKLFLFASMEAARQQGQDTGSVAAPFVTHYRIDSPKWYAKLDWNINDANILEVTGASNKASFQGSQNEYDYATRTEGGFNSYPTWNKTGAEVYTAKFTSYITDDLTLSALYGKMSGTYYSQTPGYDPTLPAVLSPDRENPALTGGGIITNDVSVSQFNDPAHTSKNTNLRLDLSYRLGSHTVTVGIDNQDVRDNDDGQVTGGPGGYSWLYENLAPTDFIKGGPVANGPNWQSQTWVDAPGNYPGGGTGYYVSKQIFNNSASVRVKQHAQYIEDSWQINDRWLVKLGLRNDQFTNYNGVGVPYMRLTKPQWAPRVGFSWDVNGDSSFKVYGNAGRYYLALPAGVALRSAGASIFTNEYFAYTGIDANGLPTGLTPIANSRNGPISTNREYGVPRDPKAATATNIKSEYQDEYILGFDKKLNDNWVYGAKATYRNLRRAIDDWGDTSRIIDKMNAMGIDPATYSADDIAGSYLFNPGENPIFKVAKLGGGYYDVPLNWRTDMGFTTSLKRKYYGLDVYLEHPFDGRWAGKVDYLFSRSYGNSEGQVRSDIGQTDVSATVDWDYAQVMEYANGALANDRRHQIKAYGSYQVAPEWMLSGNLAILSGGPRTCLGYYGPNETNPGLAYNGGYYHWCGGKPSAPGEHREAWTYMLSLSAEYRPDWADKKLGFNVMVYNVLDQQETLQTRAFYGKTGARNARYLQPMTSQTPRFVRFGVSYDF
jgi:hypothetical protein